MCADEASLSSKENIQAIYDTSIFSLIAEENARHWRGKKATYGESKKA